LLGGCPVGIDEQTFIEAVAKELNRSPWMVSLVGLWRFRRVRDGFLEQFEATADEGGHLGVAVASFNRGDEEQIKAGAVGGAATFGLAAWGERGGGRTHQVRLDVVPKDGEEQATLATEGLVEAAAVQVERFDQVVDGSSFVAAQNEGAGSGLEDFVLTESSWP
jgi:hypothetical protein